MTSKHLLFIAAFCIAIYANSLGGEFVWDDQSFVSDNVSIRTLSNFTRFFTDPRTGATGELSSDVYRPITVLSYSLDYFLWRLNSFGYHLNNILLHAANAMLVFVLLFLIADNLFIAFFASLFFAAHPVQTEVVSWISGRSSLLSLLFFLASLISYIRYSKDAKKEYYVLSVFAFAVSLFCKEMSITLPLILVLYDRHFSKKESFQKRAAAYIPYFALALFYVILRVALLKKVGQFGGWGSPSTTFLTMSTVVVDYLRILFFPIKQCAVGYPVNIVSSINDIRAVASLAILALAACSLPFLFKRFKIISFSIAWFFITLLPVLNIIPIKALEAERFLYLPSIGFCLAMAFIFYNLDKRFGRIKIGEVSIVMLLAGSLVLAYSVKTGIRNEDWKSEIAISKKTVEASPSSAWALTALGANYIQRNNYEAAIEPLKKAIEINGGYELARNALGECYVRLGMYSQAVPHLLVVTKMNPNSLNTRNMLGIAYANLNKYDKAEKQFRAALKKDDTFVNAYLNLGRLYEKKGDYGKAAKQYFKILQNTAEPYDTAVAYIRIGDAYLKMNSRQKAKTFYLKASNSAKNSAEIRKIVEERLGNL